MSEPENNRSVVILYQTEDGRTRFQVRLQEETAWLSQSQLAELFQTTKQNISLHLKNIFEERELTQNSVIKDYLTTAADGKNYRTKFYNLEATIAIGYRVKSHRGTQFRQWATARLKEYLIKGFAMDDERLKQAGGGDYFDELLQRIRDIRSSERVFWRKVLDIYATSIDYDPSVEASRHFFQTVQNKMHWAVHGQTAAEVIHARADAAKSQMGLVSWAALRPRKPDAAIAKNYLGADELEALNRIVTAYLEFAELQALDRKPMHMRDWIARLDDFIHLSGRKILKHAGNISAEAAKLKAELEFDKFERQRRTLEDEQANALLTQHLDDLTKQSKKISPTKRRAKK
jgi:hypothetical protein